MLRTAFWFTYFWLFQLVSTLFLLVYFLLGLLGREKSQAKFLHWITRAWARQMVALAGCTGMDVVSILKKMRVEPESFSVKVLGELTDEHPKQYTSLHVVYEFKGKDLPMDKLVKAVSLSEEKYCGVSAVLKKAIPVTTEIVITE